MENSKKKKNISKNEIKKFLRREHKTNWNIFKENIIQSTKTNSHRKNRSSREADNKNVHETLDIRSSAFSCTKFSKLLLSSTLSWPLSTSSRTQSPTSLLSHRRKRLYYSTMQRALFIFLLLILLGTIKAISAIKQNSHSTKTIITMDTAFESAKSNQFNSAAEIARAPTSTTSPKYSQPFQEHDNDSFRPFVPKNINLESISQNVFINNGHYRIFEPINSDLRTKIIAKRKTEEMPPDFVGNLKSFHEQSQVLTMQSNQNQKRKKTLPNKQEFLIKEESVNQQEKKNKNKEENEKFIMQGKLSNNRKFTSSNNKTTLFTQQHNTDDTEEVIDIAAEIKGLESLLADYVDDFFNKGQYQPKPELIFALQENFTQINRADEQKSRPIRQVLEKQADGDVSMNIPRALESGRLLFFAGLKKVMWPIYMGLQVLKSLMFALLLPTLIGSFGKLLGKGISSGSAPLFIRPMDEPQELDFRDNNFSFDGDSNKYGAIDDVSLSANANDGGYAYNQPEASQTNNQYTFNSALSRLNMNERQQLMQDSYLSAVQSLGAASFKNSASISGSSSNIGGGGGVLAGLVSPMRQKPVPPANTNTFKQFQKVPTSSLLLSNYDPFYSPLLSRLDSVFAQLKLNSDNEACREKLICLMYANPAKYAPYSNLVSAQLSRELNELRKPTSDNPDILRFFKYMRAAKDGQDGTDCEKSFEKCTEFKDFENPAMVSTYHDINKLVQARKFS